MLRSLVGPSVLLLAAGVSAVGQVTIDSTWDGSTDTWSESTAGMYGDLQGIAGRTLQEIEGLDLNLLPDSESN